MKTQPNNRPVITCKPSPFLRDQIREDSNHELDWLWSAEQVTAIEEIRYCLERAFYINPKNYETQRTLSKLPPRRISTSETQQVERASGVQRFNH